MNGQGCQGYHSSYQGNQSCHAECIFKIWSDLMALGPMVTAVSESLYECYWNSFHGDLTYVYSPTCGVNCSFLEVVYFTPNAILRCKR